MHRLALPLIAALATDVGAETLTAEEVRARWPARAASASAEELDRLARPLGVGLLTESHIEVDDRASAARRWAHAQIRRSAIELAPPPPEIVGYHAVHAATFAAIVRHLETAAPPRWPLDVGAAAAEESRSHELLTLHKSLIARALAAAADGDQLVAEATLRASIQLAAADDRPFLIEQLLRTATARWHLGALRWIGADPALVPMVRLPARDQLLYTLRLELWQLGHIYDLVATGAIELEPDADDHSTPSSSALGRFFDRRLETIGDWVATSWPVRAYVDTCLDDVDRALRDAFQNAPGPCAGATDRAHTRWRLARPWWNPFGVFFRDYGDLLDRADRTLVEAELTALVQALRASRAVGGEWPVGLTVESSCADRTWVYDRQPDGAIRLALEPPLAVETSSLDLPLEFVAGP